MFVHLVSLLSLKHRFSLERWAQCYVNGLRHLICGPKDGRLGIEGAAAIGLAISCWAGFHGGLSNLPGPWAACLMPFRGYMPLLACFTMNHLIGWTGSFLWENSLFFLADNAAASWMPQIVFISERNSKIREMDEIQCIFTFFDIYCVIAQMLLSMVPTIRGVFSLNYWQVSQSPPLTIDEQGA
jgi:hypothetical protein